MPIADQRRAVIFSVSGAPQHTVCDAEEVPTVCNIAEQAVVLPIEITDIQLCAASIKYLFSLHTILVNYVSYQKRLFLKSVIKHLSVIDHGERGIVSDNDGGFSTRQILADNIAGIHIDISAIDHLNVFCHDAVIARTGEVGQSVAIHTVLAVYVGRKVGFGTTCVLPVQPATNAGVDIYVFLGARVSEINSLSVTDAVTHEEERICRGVLAIVR